VRESDGKGSSFVFTTILFAVVEAEVALSVGFDALAESLLAPPELAPFFWLWDVDIKPYGSSMLFRWWLVCLSEEASAYISTSTFHHQASSNTLTKPTNDEFKTFSAGSLSAQVIRLMFFMWASSLPTQVVNLMFIVSTRTERPPTSWSLGSRIP
jgi:hypothetical protein